MPESRLARTRASLPPDYQFPTPKVCPERSEEEILALVRAADRLPRMSDEDARRVLSEMWS